MKRRLERGVILREVNTVLSKFKSNEQSASNQQLEIHLKVGTDNLKLIRDALKIRYENWILELERYREESKLLKLFSNRQIMIMLILLQTFRYNKTKLIFLRKLYKTFTWDSRNQEKINEQEQQLTIECLTHYLKSLRLHDDNLSVETISA
ncbi:unnamed protein product [Didymodactylos carnosus]|uniref:Uncharacterized protein n=1 Tax=Didymodactylos carnosus TaxID=1234261 RepID=A0A815MZ50_9BILA|nr:unnamed protein product [Didymodactylos carnosus]CAF1430054.1 unnamed protein product [Didymodactylos carnosus]CAF3745227.1 unnamed protein product [Didymodactylos carnosus]CAF4309087.1 unnamed protein product [Didymodactylos carnosus]